MIHCPLCLGFETTFFIEMVGFAQSLLRYYSCCCCQLVFLEPSFFLPLGEQRARYKWHQNDPSQGNYQNYLKKMMEPVFAKRLCSENVKVLDFGCGPTRGIEALWGDELLIDSYDPLFFPDLNLRPHYYDFIICSEVAEHFENPNKSWTQLKKLLKPLGTIVLRTAIRPFFAQDFKSWHYHRDPTHVAFYTKFTIEWIAKNFYLKIITVC